MIIENVRIKSCKVDEPNDDGRYQVIFAIDDEDKRQELIDMIDEAWKKEKVKGAGKKPDTKPYFVSEPSEEYADDEDTGSVIFLSSKKSKSKEGKELFVDVFDANGSKYKKDEIPSIGKGTVANISVDFFCWKFKRDFGISMWLNKVQVVDLVEYSGGDTFGNVSDDKFGEDGKKKKKGKKKKDVEETDEKPEKKDKKKKKKK